MNDPVEVIKDMYDAFRRGDVNRILNHLTDDVSWEFEAPAALSWGGIRKGKGEAAGFFSGIASEHSDIMFEMTDFVVDGDTVAAFGRYEATIKSTGKRVTSPVAHYFRFRDGKVVRYRNFVNTGAFVEAMA